MRNHADIPARRSHSTHTHTHLTVILTSESQKQRSRVTNIVVAFASQQAVPSRSIDEPIVDQTHDAPVARISYILLASMVSFATGLSTQLLPRASFTCQKEEGSHGINSIVLLQSRQSTPAVHSRHTTQHNTLVVTMCSCTTDR